MDNGKYGPYEVEWAGPCVWAAILEELPPELVGRKVYLIVADDEPADEPHKVVNVHVEPSGTISFEMDNGKHHVIPAHYDMPNGIAPEAFVHVALANALLHAHERIDAIKSHDPKDHTVKVLPFVSHSRSTKPTDKTSLFKRITNTICNLFS